MALADLLATMERRAAVTPETPCNPDGVTAKPLQHKACTPVTPVTLQKSNGAKDARIVGAGNTAATSWGWRVTYPEDHPGDRFSGGVFETYIVPLQTLAEVQAIHPGARIEPIPEGAG